MNLPLAIISNVIVLLCIFISYTMPWLFQYFHNIFINFSISPLYFALYFKIIYFHVEVYKYYYYLCTNLEGKPVSST